VDTVRTHSVGAGARHYAGSITGVLVGYVRRAYGDDTIHRILARAGEARPPEELENVDAWSSYDEVVSLYQAAVDGPKRKNPASRSSKLPKMLGESKRGTQSQSIAPSGAINAPVWQFDKNA
jgi:hypothetical protein